MMRFGRTGGAMALAAGAMLVFGFTTADAQERGVERQAETTPPRAVPAAALTATSQQAQLRASGAFLQLGSVEGESTRRAGGREGHIDVLSWSWGTRAGGAGAGGRIALGAVNEVTITKLVDKATPKLAESVSRGQNVGTVVLEARPRGGARGDYVRYTLHDVIVSSVRPSGSDGSAPTETLSLNFGKVEVDYRSRKLSGMLGDPAHAAEARQ